MILCIGVFSTSAHAADKMEVSKVRRNGKIEEIVKQNEGRSRKLHSYQEAEEFLGSAVSGNALANKSNKEIEKYFSGKYSYSASDNTSSAGAITDPIKYLRNNVGKSSDTYSVTKTKTFSKVKKTTCTSWNDGNNCTLTALYNIMCYYRSIGYSKIPTTASTLYSKIRVEAVDLGFTQSGGLGVTKNNNLVKNTWRNGFGYSSGNGSNNYLWTYDTCIDAIDNARPFLFSLASGYYYDHTVAVYGYKTYKNDRTGKKYTFLVLADGWSSSTRYMAWKNTGESYVGCVTSITTPS